MTSGGGGMKLLALTRTSGSYASSREMLTPGRPSALSIVSDEMNGIVNRKGIVERGSPRSR